MRASGLKKYTFILTLIAALALFIPTFAQDSAPPPQPLVLTVEQDQYPLGLHLEILEDPSGELTIEDVTSPEFDTQFVPSQAEVPNYGFTDSAYWVRLRLDNETRQINEWLLELGFANMHYVDLYAPLPDGEGFDVKQTGVLRPVSTRDVLHPRIVFDLSVPIQNQPTYYLRFQNGASMTLPLTLWAQTAFLDHSLLVQIAQGVFFGVLIGLLFYNLFLFFSLREVSYLYFVILLASLIIEEAAYDGYLEIYVIPNLYNLMQYIMPLSFSLLIGSMVLFSDSFLETRRRLPKLHLVNLVILAGWGALMLLTPFTSYHIIANLMVPWALFSLIAVLIAGITSWRQGFHPARFFMIAWLGLIASLSWVFLVRLGVFPSTFFSENAYRLGYLWMAVCWSIALADRINLLKAETEDANRLLRNSERKLSQILEGLPLGVVVYGKDQKPTYTNRRMVEMLSNPAQGIQPDISAGRTISQAIKYFSFRLAGSGQEYPLEKFPVINALHGEPASVDDVEANLGDKHIPLEIWVSPVMDDAGDVESAVAAVQDITQRKQAEAELAEYRKHLELLVENRTEELQSANKQLTIEATERKILELSLHQRIEWLSAVNKIHQTIAGAATLGTAYEELTAKILQLLGATLVFILRWDDQSKQSGVFCYSLPGGFTPEINIMKASFQKGSPLRRDVELGKIIIWPTDQAASLPFGEYLQEHDLQSLVLAPMIIRQSVVGVLGVAASKPAQDFSSQQVDLVERMAFDLADLAQDATLLDQALTLATFNERNRLARDLHDSVTQVLFSASLLAEVMPQIWRRDPEQGLQRLDKLRRLTRGALAEMRTMLLELRPTAVINTPLDELLAQLTEAVASRSGLPFQLFIDQIPSLPDNVQINFYRIAQEALNNVVKHAQAEQVTVSLSATPLTPDAAGGARHEVKLVIRDDGVGYAPGKRRPDRQGIGIMYERAAAIQADLSLDSQPGYGTQVTLIWSNESGNL